MSMRKSLTKTLLLTLLCGMIVSIIGVMAGGSTSLYFEGDRFSFSPKVTRYITETGEMVDIAAFRAVEINLSVGSLDIVHGSEPGVTYTVHDAEYSPTMRVDNGVLHISNGGVPNRFHVGIGTSGGARVTLTLPLDMPLEFMNLRTDFGLICISDGVMSKRVLANSQVGGISVSNVTCDELELDTVTSRIYVSNTLTAKRLRINTRTGDIHAWGDFRGETRFTSDTGDIDLMTVAGREQYRLEAHGEYWRRAGMPPEGEAPNAPHQMYIHTKLGNVNYEFGGLMLATAEELGLTGDPSSTVEAAQ